MTPIPDDTYFKDGQTVWCVDADKYGFVIHTGVVDSGVRSKVGYGPAYWLVGLPGEKRALRCVYGSLWRRLFGTYKAAEYQAQLARLAWMSTKDNISMPWFYALEAATRAMRKECIP